MPCTEIMWLASVIAGNNIGGRLLLSFPAPVASKKHLIGHKSDVIQDASLNVPSLV